MLHITRRAKSSCSILRPRMSSKLCASAGEIMVSAMGDAEGKAKGGFVLLDEDFKVLLLIAASTQFLLRYPQNQCTREDIASTFFTFSASLCLR